MLDFSGPLGPVGAISHAEEELVKGVERLKGTAKGIDLASFIAEYRSLPEFDTAETRQLSLQVPLGRCMVGTCLDHLKEPRLSDSSPNCLPAVDATSPPRNFEAASPPK